MDYTIRKATEDDKLNIARAASYSFEETFRVFTKDMERMAKVYENHVATDRFFVAEQDGEFLRIIAHGNREGRVLGSTKEECIKHLGALRGRLAFSVIKKEQMRPHPYPAATGYIDIVGVLPKARGKGLAKELLTALITANPQYDEFILDVDSGNVSAVKSYMKFGFVEYKRGPAIPFSKRARLFMKYIPKRG